jgi:glycosyltransferase involved in cell wall biosynthesis
MTAKTCYVMSFKYTPVMWNIGQALGESIRLDGYPVQYLLADAYRWLIDQDRVNVGFMPKPHSPDPLSQLAHFVRGAGYGFVKQSFEKAPPHTLILTNLNPLVDRIVVGVAKKVNPGARVIILLHEPYTAEKNVYGRKRAVLLTFHEMLSRQMARQSNAVILMSPQGLSAFDRLLPDFKGERRVMPLPFIDKVWPEALERHYVTFLGHTRHKHQKGVDLFFEMVEECCSQHCNLQFQLISGSDVTALVSGLSPQAQARLKVVSSTKLRDEDISKALRESIAVILLQRRVMQSAVIPAAFMNGTPVVVPCLPGFTQFVEHGRTGWILPIESSLTERFEAVENIRQRLDVMSPLCRRSYEETFDSRQVHKHVAWILGDG